MELPGAKRLGDDRRPLGTLRCWRHSDIGPARGIVVTPALKEWSAAVHALLDGRQTVLLRKGVVSYTHLTLRTILCVYDRVVAAA